jgi:general secretion pathway protein G
MEEKMNRITKQISKTAHAGFTMVEVLLVVVIIGIIASIGIPRVAGRTEKARISKAAATINLYSTALSTYEMEKGTYPASLEELKQESDDGSPYMERLKMDPWGKPFTYVSPGANNRYSYDLSTTSAKGESINNWED